MRIGAIFVCAFAANFAFACAYVRYGYFCVADIFQNHIVEVCACAFVGFDYYYVVACDKVDARCNDVAPIVVSVRSARCGLAHIQCVRIAALRINKNQVFSRSPTISNADTQFCARYGFVGSNAQLHHVVAVTPVAYPTCTAGIVFGKFFRGVIFHKARIAPSGRAAKFEVFRFHFECLTSCAICACRKVVSEGGNGNGFGNFFVTVVVLVVLFAYGAVKIMYVACLCAGSFRGGNFRHCVGVGCCAITLVRAYGIGAIACAFATNFTHVLTNMFGRNRRCFVKTYNNHTVDIYGNGLYPDKLDCIFSRNELDVVFGGVGTIVVPLFSFQRIEEGVLPFNFGAVYLDYNVCTECASFAAVTEHHRDRNFACCLVRGENPCKRVACNGKLSHNFTTACNFNVLHDGITVVRV